MQKVVHKSTKGIEAAVRREVAPAMLAWAEVVISHASAHAPILTGQLRRSIVHSEVQRRGDTLVIQVGPDQSVKDYAARQEFDTTLGFGPTSVAANATRPWLRPAYDAAVVVGRALVRAAFARAVR